MNTITTAKARSAAEIRAEFDRKGLSIAEFSRQHNLSYSIVYQVLSGLKKGRRGECHRAAVLLGLKEGEAA